MFVYVANTFGIYCRLYRDLYLMSSVDEAALKRAATDGKKRTTNNNSGRLKNVHI